MSPPASSVPLRAAQALLLLLSLSLPRTARAITPAACDPATFTFPPILGASPVTIAAVPVRGFSPALRQTPEASGPALPEEGINLCNVTVSYTRPGRGGLVSAEVWLPLSSSPSSKRNGSSTPSPSSGWNGRFVGVGGSGLSTGSQDSETMALYLHRGFAVATTDGGRTSRDPFSAEGALVSPGNVNWDFVMDFGYRSLHEMSIIGKAITAQFFGSPSGPRKSYFVGCSTGGRQGLMLAQRFPDDFDGVLAGCPGMNVAAVATAIYWPQLVMNRLGTYPSPCQLRAIETAAVTACDELDGQKDGIVAAWEDCRFDPRSVVGQTVSCGDGSKQRVSEAAAIVAQATWGGARHYDGEVLFPGSPVGTSMTSLIALAVTQCSNGTTAGNGTATSQTCVGVPNPLGTLLLRYFWKKDPTFDPTTLTIDQYRDAFYDTRLEFDGPLANDDPNLSRFRRSGGKMISWHGVNDELITMKNTRNYYRRVIEKDRGVGAYYRHFEVPGATHCSGRPGVAYPVLAFDALMKWVEEGVAPKFLPGNVLGPDGVPTEKQKKICPYPARAVYNGGDPGVVSSYSCV